LKTEAISSDRKLLGHHGIFLFGLRNVPFDEVVVDARGGGFDAAEAPGYGGQGVRDEEEGVGLVFG
jgi:hypothetical protein